MKRRWISFLLALVMAVGAIGYMSTARAMGDYSGNLTGATWYWPLHGYSSTSSAFGKISSSYGYRGHNATETYNRFHYGVDIGETKGTAVYATRAGTVETVVTSLSSSAGRYVVINHLDGYYSVYMHLSSVDVTKGQSVDEYTQIGKVGGSGTTETSYAAHLHLGIHYGTSYSRECNVNPCPKGYTRVGASFKESNGGYPVGEASIEYTMVGSSLSEKTTLTFFDLTTPGTLEVGSVGHIDGRITSTNSPITSVKAEVIEAATGKTMISSSSSGFSVQSYGPLKSSKVDNNLKFGTLAVGTYYIKYTATAMDGTTETGQTTTFQVVGSGDAHTHTLVHVAAKTVTCETDGNIEYWYCSECGKYFANLSATTEIAGAPLPIEKLGHKLSHVPAKAATETAEGNIEYWSCSRCGKYFSDSATTREISLSSTVISKLTPVPTHTPAVTADIIDSGTCGVWGDNATWTLDFDGTLTISGRGGMANYNEHEVSYYVHTIDSPWDQYRDNIQKIVVGEGITSLGMNAFSRFTNVTSVSLPSSLTTIGIDAFRLCKMLKKIDIPNSVTTVGMGAFWASGLSEAALPDDITDIAENVFSSCENLTRITIPRSVMSIDEWAFFFCDNLTDVYYSGSLSDWNKISIADKDSSNKYLFDATIHYNSTGPTDTTNEPSPQPVVMSKIDVHFNRHTNYIQGQFTDVPANQWFTSGVTDAYEFGLMKGNSASTFNPYGDVTLAEAITMAARIHAIYTNGEENFVQSGTWYQVYLDYAYNNGIISRAYYNADVSRKATRAQFAEFFANALPDGAIYPTNAIADNAIPDVPMGMTYAPYVYKLYRAGILTGGDSMGTFSPDTYITRSEAATIVSRMAESNNRKSFTL